MENLKNSSNAWIGFRHFIVAGLATPVLLNIILAVLAYTIFPGIITISGVIGVETLVSAIGLYLGVLYSVKWLKKTFVISSPNSIINISVAWFIAFQLLLSFSFYLTGSAILATTLKDTPTFLFINVLVLAIVFYVLNRIFLKSNP